MTPSLECHVLYEWPLKKTMQRKTHIFMSSTSSSEVIQPKYSEKPGMKTECLSMTIKMGAT